MNFAGELFAYLKKAGCRIVGSDQLVKIEACNRYTFPDLMIVCQKARYEKAKNGLDALENPEVIVEVASESTELYEVLSNASIFKRIRFGSINKKTS